MDTNTEATTTTSVVDVVTTDQISTEAVIDVTTEKEMEAFVSNRSSVEATEASTQQFSEEDDWSNETEEVDESAVAKSRSVTPSVVWMNAG